MTHDSREWLRKSVHMGSAIFALTIGRLTPPLVSLFIAMALVFNLFVLPRITKRSLERDVDLQRGFSIGILLYPAVLLVISLVWQRNQAILAIAWGLMAFGDGFAGLAGRWAQARSSGCKTIPWNTSKTWVGSLAFFLCGWACTLILLVLLPANVTKSLSPLIWIIVVGISALVAAWVETLSGLIDDNLAVPLSAAFTAWLTTLFISSNLVLLPLWSVSAITLACVLALSSVFLKKMSVPGAFVGLFISIGLIAGTGWEGFAYLGAFFFLGTMATRWGKDVKRARGLAQENKGIRTVRHAFANGLVPAVGGILALVAPDPIWAIAIAGSFAAAASDTMSSEIGNVYGKNYVHILTFQPVERGLDGGISLHGSFAGILGSLIISLCCMAFGQPMVICLIVFVAGCLGNLIDSILGATLQQRGYMTNDSVNFLMSLAGFSAALAMAWVYMAN